MVQQWESHNEFAKIQQRGRRKLRLAILVLFLFLSLFFVVSSILFKLVFNGDDFIHYVLLNAIEASLWIICILLLWNTYKMGRLFFLVLVFVDIYSLSFLYTLFHYPLHGIAYNVIRIAIFLIFCIKYLFLFMTCLRIYQKPIGYIWHTSEQLEQVAQEEDRQMIHQLMHQQEGYQTQLYSRKKIIIKARQHLRLYTFLLFTFLYGSLLVFYFSGFLIRGMFSYDKEGIDYAQRYILLASLFSVLVWSFPAIMLFLHKRIVKLAILVAWICEAIRLLSTIVPTTQMVVSQHYGWPTIGMMVFMEGLRYLVLLRMTVSFLQDPYICASWKQKRDETY